MALIPFFVINFFLCGVFIASLVIVPTMMPFILPFATVVVLVLLPSSIILTYISMLATSAANLGYMFSQVKRKRPFVHLILHIVFHFVFVLDVVSATMLYQNEKNTPKNEDEKEAISS